MTSQKSKKNCKLYMYQEWRFLNLINILLIHVIYISYNIYLKSLI